MREEATAEILGNSEADGKREIIQSTWESQSPGHHWEN